METINLSIDDFNKLKKLEIINTTNKDGELFYLPSKDEILIFKKFYDFDADEFLNKICTVINLYTQKQDSPINSLIYPEALITVEGSLKGYARKYINGISLKEILASPNISFEVKKNSLIQIGRILEQMQYMREHSNNPDFYLNDIHEGNFIVENNTENVKVIDLDSASIKGNHLSPSMYLRPTSMLTLYKNKYFLEKNNPIYERQIVPNQNTEIYCYSIMILNFLYGRKISFMPKYMLQKYLDYLSKLDYNPELLNIFSKLYTNEGNINPVNFLNDLQDNPQANAKFFQKVLRKKSK